MVTVVYALPLSLTRSPQRNTHERTTLCLHKYAPQQAASCVFIGRLHYFISRSLAVSLGGKSSKTSGHFFLFYILRGQEGLEVTWRR